MSRIHLKSDERILGHSGFVDEILFASEETLERRYALKARQVDVNYIAGRVSVKRGSEIAKGEGYELI